MTNKPNIFFSHSSRDKSVMARLKDLFMQKTGGTIDVFLSSDGQSIQLGRNWAARVEQALDDCEVMIIFVTPNSVDSKWIYFEGGYGYARDLQVVPVGFLGVSIAELSPPLSLLQGFDLQSYDGLNNLIDIANKSFEHSHTFSFTESDYDKLVELSPTSSGLGPYTRFIESIQGGLELAPAASVTLLEGLLSSLDEAKIIYTRKTGEKGDTVTMMGCQIFRDDNRTPEKKTAVIRCVFTPRGAVAYYKMFQTVLGTASFRRVRVTLTRDIEECNDRLLLSELLFGLAEIADNKFSLNDILFEVTHSLRQVGRGEMARSNSLLILDSEKTIMLESVVSLLTACFESGAFYSN